MAMRSVGSSVAKARFGQLSLNMKRLWVEEVEQKPVQASLILAGGIMYGGYKCDDGVRKIRDQLHKERAECVAMRERVVRKRNAYYAKQGVLVKMVATEVASLKEDPDNSI